MNINDLGRVADGDQALPPSAPEPYGLGPSGYDPSRLAVDGAVEELVRESNRIEGIEFTSSQHYSATWQFLRAPITIPALVELVHWLQPDARFRNEVGVQGVSVGNHIAPPSGPKIETDLRRILAMRDPWEQHVAYETLHPFTDGNGRSGRAIWMHRFYNERNLDPWAIRRGFLHSFYYQTLGGVRVKDRNPEGEDRHGLRA